MAVKGNARRLIQIPWDQVKALARIHCTPEEICAVLGTMDLITLERICKRDHKISLFEFLKRENRYGNVGIRRAQWKLAVDELDGSMLRFLGKQLLGQTEEINVNLPPVSTRFGADAAGQGGPLVQIVIKTKDDKPAGPTAMALRWYDTQPPDGSPPLADDIPVQAKPVEATVEPGTSTGQEPQPSGVHSESQASGYEVDAPPAARSPDDLG